MHERSRMMNNIMKSKVNVEPSQVLEDIVYALDQSAIVALADRQGRIIYANELFAKMSKYEVDELIGQKHNIVNSGYHPPAFFKEMWRQIGSGKMWTGQIKNKAKDGTYYWVDTVIVPFLNDRGIPYQYISIRWDITEKKEMEEAVKESAELYRIITENSSDFIAVIDIEGQFKYVSPSYENNLGYPIEQLMAYDLWTIVHPEDREVIEYRIRQNIGYAQNNFPLELRIMTSEREVRYMKATVQQVRDEGKYEGFLVVVMHDITHRKQTEERLQSLASNDQLTMLLNRTAFRRHLFDKIHEAQRKKAKLAVVYMNIDRFRYVNDTLGHQAGDELLQVIANRLKSVLHEEDAIGRIAGDEFAFTLSNIYSATDAVELSEEVRHLLQEPIHLNEEEYEITLSSGIALYPDHAMKASDLVARAEKALHIAKTYGGNGYEVYTPGTVTKTLERILLENELRKSVEARHFALEYQPKVNLATGEYCGFEALVRWVHPDLGRIAPDKFIPLAEETKIIIPLGEWILNEACRQKRAWLDEGYPRFQMAVNMSSIQLEDPNIENIVRAALNKYDLDPALLEIELTESAFADRQELSNAVERLRNIGISVAIDDFGTGYSTFSYIKELPVDTVKIDRSFVKDIDENKDSQAIVSAIVTLATTAGLDVVAEGVESEKQGEILYELGCQVGQGYFYSRPVPAEECTLLLDEQFKE